MMFVGLFWLKGTRMIRKNVVAVLLISVSVIECGAQPYELTTSFSANNGLYGNAFDVKNTGSNPLQIEQFAVNLETGSEPYPIKIYTKTGSYLGSETNADVWTLIHTESIASAGTDIPTLLSVLSASITVWPSTTQAVWIGITPSVNGQHGLRTITGASEGGLKTSDIDTGFEIYEGIAFSCDNIHPSDTCSFSRPRIWSGTIYYSVGTFVPTAIPSVTPTYVPTPAPTAIPSTTPTQTPTDIPTKLTLSPTHNPTKSPTLFIGETLLASGFNLFKNSRSGKIILNANMMEENIEHTTVAAKTCDYDSLQFTSIFSSYADYADSDAESIKTAFSAIASAAGGSLSRRRIETRSSVISTQSEIYSMYLQCKVREASIVGSNNLYWNPAFIASFRTLPHEYSTGDNLEPYIDFWNDYGTHIIGSAQFGGSIRGTVIVDLCKIMDSWHESKAFDMSFVNSAYQGISSESIADIISKSIINTRISIKGGDIARFTQIFNEFTDKTNDFQGWIGDLENEPDIIGGIVNEIHHVIKNTLALGNHNLNRNLTVIYDDIYLIIADSLENAYNDYAVQLSIDDTVFSDNECKVDCIDGKLSVSQCICTNCTRYSCCPTKIVSTVTTTVSPDADKAGKVHVLNVRIIFTALMVYFFF